MVSSGRLHEITSLSKDRTGKGCCPFPVLLVNNGFGQFFNPRIDMVFHATSVLS